MVVFFLCCPFFPRGVLDEILNLIESVSVLKLCHGLTFIQEKRPFLIMSKKSSAASD